MSQIALFSAQGVIYLFKWLHIFFGIVWIGHLYYFNFVQGGFFAETDATTKSNAIQKLLPRALWWFRYGALFTFLTGVILLTGRYHTGTTFVNAYGIQIILGMVLGTIMFLNVWLIIWPNQKIVIESATLAASGKAALPQAAAAGAKALLASRTNTLFSFAMLFFMAGARNLTLSTDENSNFTLALWVPIILVLLIELNAIKGKLGPMATVKGVIHMGIVLTVVLYGVVEFFL